MFMSHYFIQKQLQVSDMGDSILRLRNIFYWLCQNTNTCNKTIYDDLFYSILISVFVSLRLRKAAYKGYSYANTKSI